MHTDPCLESICKVFGCRKQQRCGWFDMVTPDLQKEEQTEIADNGRFSALFPEYSFECDQPLIVGLTMKDIDRVLATLMDEQNVTLFAIISLVLCTGMTTEEICGLKIHQLIATSQADQYGIMLPGTRNVLSKFHLSFSHCCYCFLSKQTMKRKLCFDQP